MNIDYKLIIKLSRFYKLDKLTVYHHIKLGHFKDKIKEFNKG